MKRYKSVFGGVTDAAGKFQKALKVIQATPGFKFQKALQQLQVAALNLDDTPVTDAGLKDIATLKNLTRLSLLNTKVTDAGVRELQKALPGCKIAR